MLIDSQGLQDCPGYSLAGVSCDIRNKGNDRLDLALLRSDHPCQVAGVFTRHALPAAPVVLGREICARGRPVRGLVANSGNANACTGADGLADAREMQAAAAAALGVAPEEVFVCSTGRIGERLPMEKIKTGLVEGAGRLAATPEESIRAAEAILTSDTRRKVATARFTVGEQTVTVAGMAKGAGMIEPNMATMLAFLVTDAVAGQDLLAAVLKSSVQGSFNAVTVDGDRSTNDTVLLFANDASGVDVSKGEAAALFARAVNLVCGDLADKIVGDGEKITKVVEILLTGAVSSAEAEKAARAIGNSLLVKSSWYGNDPNWGRVADAVGYSGAMVTEASLKIYYGEVPAFLGGHPQWDRRAEWKAIVARPRFTLRVDLGQGEASYRLLASDLTEGYVHFNKSE